jgi:hypothetical protein
MMADACDVVLDVRSDQAYVMPQKQLLHALRTELGTTRWLLLALCI